MKVSFDLYHPFQVHLFKHALLELEQGNLSDFVELEEEYEMLITFINGSEEVAKETELTTDSESADWWERRRTGIIDERVDVTVDKVEVFLNAGGAS